VLLQDIVIHCIPKFAKIHLNKENTTKDHEILL